MAAASSNAAAETTEAVARDAAKGVAGCFRVIARLVKACCETFGSCVKTMSVRTVSVLLRVLNIGNAVLLAVAAWFAYQIANSVTRFFLATYIGLFAVMLFAFESRFRYTEKLIRRSFGFMFTYSGRAVFLIFLGAICFGMLDSSGDQKDTAGYNWCLGVGLATLANAVFNCFIICNHPGFQRGAGAAQSAEDPSRMTDAEIRAYLEAHPELAAAAAGGFKASHPQPGASVDASNVVIGGDEEAGGAEAVPDWAAGRGGGGAGTGQAKAGSGGGGGFGGMFGFGKGKGGKGGSTPAGDAAYAPPSVPAAAPAPAAPAGAPSPPAFTGVAESNPFDAPGGASGSAAAAPPLPPRRGQGSSGAAAAATSPASAGVPAPAPAAGPAPDEEDNPFASGGF